MANNVIKFNHKEHEITVSKAYGSDDGYYWDKEYFVIIDNKPYIYLVIGSDSGWVSNEKTLKQVNFDYLKDRKKENTSRSYNSVTISDFENDEQKFIRLFDFMMENNSSEVRETDEYDYKLNEYKMIIVEEQHGK